MIASQPPSLPRRRSGHLVLALALALGLSTLLGASSAQAGLLYGGRPLWIGLGGATGGRIGLVEENVGVGIGSFGIGLRLIPLVPEAGLRIGPAGDPVTVLQNVWVGLRVMLPGPPFLRPNFRIAFSQMNELPAETWLDDPPKGLFGTHPDVSHRVGFETSIGLEFMADPQKILGIWVQATAIVLPDEQGPPFTGLLEVGISLEAGPK